MGPHSTWDSTWAPAARDVSAADLPDEEAPTCALAGGASESDNNKLKSKTARRAIDQPTVRPDISSRS
jgi:hypothetical protein